MDDHKLIGQRLRQERERLQLSQSVLAEETGVGRKTQYNYEEGDRSPDTNYLVKAAAIGVDVVYVLTGARMPPAAVTSQGVQPISEDEQALLSRFRRMPLDERESFLQIVGVLASKRGARKTSKVKQVIHGDVGQVFKNGTVNIDGGINIGGKPKK